jgi:outer membrane biosynthesis protein TonB
MPEFLIPIFIFYLIYLYLTMKTTKAPTEKPIPTTKTEKPVVTVDSKPKPKKLNPPKKAPKKSQAGASTPEPKAAIEQPVVAVITEAKPKKISVTSKASKTPETVVSKTAEVMPLIPLPERVGLTAGSIWQYLDKNGSTPVAKLVRELPEEEKIIQRSIGWLAQEGKITLDKVVGVETIDLQR